MLRKYLEKIKNQYRVLPDKKRYLEFVTAFLSIPVLLTVIILNITNLRSRYSKSDAQEPVISTSPQVVTIVEKIESSPGNPAEIQPQITPQPSAATPSQCVAEIGPVAIISPAENQIVTDNLVSIDIAYDHQGKYCGVVWSYRLNGGPWSSYTDKSINIYNLENGPKKIDVRVKSLASAAEKILTVNFIYNGAVASPSPSASPV